MAVTFVTLSLIPKTILRVNFLGVLFLKIDLFFSHPNIRETFCGFL